MGFLIKEVSCVEEIIIMSLIWAKISVILGGEGYLLVGFMKLFCDISESCICV